MQENKLQKIYELTNLKNEIEKQIQSLFKEIETEGITQIGKYSLQIKRTPRINPILFRMFFGQEIFNKVAEIPFEKVTTLPKQIVERCMEYIDVKTVTKN